MEINFDGTFTAFIPLVTGLIQVIKISGMPKKWLPLLGVILGVMLCVGFYGITVSAVFMGLVAGLAASGLWSNYSAVKK